MAGRRERRRPAEAAPLCETHRWTRLFRKFTGEAWERQAPPRGNPSGTTPPAGRGGPGPFTPLRCPGFCEGSQAVTNPWRGCASLHLPPLDAAWSQGLVTAHSRVPRQRSSPTREASLGLRLPSALPRDRAVGLVVVRHTVWGRWCRARSRRIWRCTGTAPAAGSLGLTGPPASMLGHRGCAAGQVGEDDLDSRLPKLGSPQFDQNFTAPVA